MDFSGRAYLALTELRVIGDTEEHCESQSLSQRDFATEQQVESQNASKRKCNWDEDNVLIKILLFWILIIRSTAAIFRKEVFSQRRAQKVARGLKF